MSRTVSVKPTTVLSEQCDSCHLFFQWLNPSAGGRFLCGLCVRLEPGNRSTGRGVQVAAGEVER
jgi:hypothetical protein